MIILNEINLNSQCGKNLTGAEEANVVDSENYVFLNDPSFDTLTLYDSDGNVVNVNSWQECMHYTNGGWDISPPETFDYSILYLLLIIFSLFLTFFYLIKKKNISKSSFLSKFDLIKNKFFLFINSSKTTSSVLGILFIIQNFYIFDYVKRKSINLNPFVDEYISITSNVEFFKNFDFNAGTSLGGSYSVYLTSGPVSAIGSVIGWNITNNFTIARISNFYWIYFLQLIFCFILYKTYKINNRFMFVSTGIFLLLIPWWIGPLYSLGEVASTLLFVNSIFLFNRYRRISMILFSTSIFFGKLLLIVPFGAFYLAYFLFERNIYKFLKDTSFFLIPLLSWVFLVSLNYESGTVYDYFKNMYELIANHQSSGVDTFSSFSFGNILNNLYQSEYVQWNRYDVFRLLYFPIIFIILVLRNKASIENIFGKIVVPLISSITITYIWFWILSETKWIRYSQHFTVIIIISILLLIGFRLVENKLDLMTIVISIALLIDDSKELLIPLIILSVFIVLIKKVDNRIIYIKFLIFLFISINFIFPYYEYQETPRLDFIIQECNETLLNEDCKNNYFDE